MEATLITGLTVASLNAIGWPESLNPLDLNGGSGTETNASLMINLQPEEIVVNGSPIQTGDLIGMFYESNGEYVCAGFIVMGFYNDISCANYLRTS